MKSPMKLHDLRTVMRFDEKIVIYDRFNRLLEHCDLQNVDEHLMKYEVRDLYVNPLYGCIAVKLACGKFHIHE